MVSLLTVLITQTFLVGHSGNFERSPPTSTVFRFNNWKLSVHYIENILTFSLHELLLVPEFGYIVISKTTKLLTKITMSMMAVGLSFHIVSYRFRIVCSGVF